MPYLNLGLQAPELWDMSFDLPVQQYFVLAVEETNVCFPLLHFFLPFFYPSFILLKKLFLFRHLFILFHLSFSTSFLSSKKNPNFIGFYIWGKYVYVGLFFWNS